HAGPHLVRDAAGADAVGGAVPLPGAPAGGSLLGRGRGAAPVCSPFPGGGRNRGGGGTWRPVSGGIAAAAGLHSTSAEEGPTGPKGARPGVRVGTLPAVLLRPATDYLRGGLGGRSVTAVGGQRQESAPGLPGARRRAPRTAGANPAAQPVGRGHR